MDLERAAVLGPSCPAPSRMTSPVADPTDGLSSADVTDVPPDILALIFSHLNPGHRLDLRAVSRRWADWVDNVLVRFTHVNLIMDTNELRGVLKLGEVVAPSATPADAAWNSDPFDSGSTCLPRFDQLLRRNHRQAAKAPVETASTTSPVCTVSLCSSPPTAFSPAVGVLAHRFPNASSVRLWVGCRPPASVAGLNGGNADDLTTRDDTVAYGSNDSSPRQAARQAAVAVASAIVKCGQAVRETLYERYIDLAVACMVKLLRVNTVYWEATRRRRRWRAPPYVTTIMPVAPSWHKHMGTGDGEGIDILRRTVQQAADPALEPLPACLPLLGRSTCLTRLSIVTTFDVTAEELRQLFAAFPRLASLGLHAHLAPFADPTMVAVTSLEPLIAVGPGSGKLSLPCAPRDNEGTCQPEGAESVISGGHLANGFQTKSLLQPTGPPSLPNAPRPSPPPAGGAAPMLRTLVLSGVRCEWPREAGLQNLTQLRALVLHRSAGRMHHLVPQIQALTQLTRLELRRLDYHFSVPLTATERQQVADRIRLNTQRLERRRERARRRGVPDASSQGPSERQHRPPGPHQNGGRRAQERQEAGLEVSLDSTDSEAEEAGGSGPVALAAAGERQQHGKEGHDERWRALEHVPWLHERNAPDWRRSMRSLGRAVCGMPDLRVLVCDVECPPDMDTRSTISTRNRPTREGGWAFLLAAIRQLRNLVELRLPCMVLTHPEQVFALAAAVPELRTLELGTLPPPPRNQARGADGDPDAEEMLHYLRSHWYWGEHCTVDRSAIEVARSKETAGTLPSMGDLRRIYLGEAGVNVDGEPRQGESAVCAENGGVEVASASGSCCGAHWGDGRVKTQRCVEDGLAAFKELRELVVRRTGVPHLAAWLPLPPRLRRFEAPLQWGTPLTAAWDTAITRHDLQALHCALLPALSLVPEVHLTLTSPVRMEATWPSGARYVPGGMGLLLVAMLAAWLRGCLVSLDVMAATHPNLASEAQAVGCLRIAASGLPQLRRLSCCLWQTDTRGPMHPGGPAHPVGPTGGHPPGAPPAPTTHCCAAGAADGSAGADGPSSADKAAPGFTSAGSQTAPEASPSTSHAGAAGGLDCKASVKPRWKLPAKRPNNNSDVGDSCNDVAGTSAGSRTVGGNGTDASGTGSVASASEAAASGSHTVSSEVKAAAIGSGTCGSTGKGGVFRGACGAGCSATSGRDAGARPCNGVRGLSPLPPRVVGRDYSAEGQRSAVECINSMPLLQELRVKVLTKSSHAASQRTTHFLVRSARVPAGLLEALTRSLRVVDCAPVDAWISTSRGGGDADPRETLRQARTAAASNGGRCLLLSEVEDWSAGAMGLGADMEAAWRRDDWE